MADTALAEGLALKRAAKLDEAVIALEGGVDHVDGCLVVRPPCGSR